MKKVRKNGLRKLRDIEGFSMEEAANGIGGITRSGYEKKERGERGLEQEFIERAARFYGVTENAIMNPDSKEQPKVGNKNSIWTIHSTLKSDVIPAEVVPSSRHRNQQVSSESGIISENQLFTGVRDLPVYAASAGGNGHDIIDNDPIDYVKRPHMLEHVKDAYGMLQVNDSMIPEIRPGDVSLVNPRLPPNRNETYIFYQNDGLGGSKATTKHLIAVNDTDWTVEQWLPPKKFKLKRCEWPIAHRVVGKYSAR